MEKTFRLTTRFHPLRETDVVTNKICWFFFVSFDKKENVLSLCNESGSSPDTVSLLVQPTCHTLLTGNGFLTLSDPSPTLRKLQ